MLDNCRVKLILSPNLGLTMIDKKSCFWNWVQEITLKFTSNLFSGKISKHKLLH